LFVVLAILATATPALACPVGALCASVELAMPRAETRRAESPRGARIASTAVRRDSTLVASRDVWNLGEAIAKPSTTAMPWIWQVLRTEVYARMPRYRDDDFTFVLSPVVVAGQFDTVPGVGLAGDF